MSRRREAVFVISVAARLSGMHPQTLRIYERRGLVSPYRTEGGTRRYSQEDIDRLLLISELTSAGLNLEGVKMVMELQEEISAIRREQRRRRRQPTSWPGPPDGPPNWRWRTSGCGPRSASWTTACGQSRENWKACAASTTGAFPGPGRSPDGG